MSNKVVMTIQKDLICNHYHCGKHLNKTCTDIYLILSVRDTNKLMN